MHDPYKRDNVGKGNEQAFQWYQIQCYDKDNNDKEATEIWLLAHKVPLFIWQD